jgi:rhomboid protease GluP
MNSDIKNGEYPTQPEPEIISPDELKRPLPQIQIKFKGSKPIIVYAIMGITILIYILQYLSQQFLGVDIPRGLGLKVNELIVAGQFWRLFTPMLLHGSILHILLNMYALYILGRGLEYNFGHWRFLALYIGAGFAGNVASFIFSPNPSLGSSTAIFGLLAAEAVFVFQNKKFYGTQAKRILINAAVIAGINLFLGLSPGIDNWGHLGGLMGGVLFTWFGGPLWEMQGLHPNFEIVDQHTSNHIWIAFGLTMLVFGAAVLVRLFVIN